MKIIILLLIVLIIVVLVITVVAHIYYNSFKTENYNYPIITTDDNGAKVTFSTGKVLMFPKLEMPVLTQPTEVNMVQPNPHIASQIILLAPFQYRTNISDVHQIITSDVILKYYLFYEFTQGSCGTCCCAAFSNSFFHVVYNALIKDPQMRQHQFDSLPSFMFRPSVDYLYYNATGNDSKYYGSSPNLVVRYAVQNGLVSAEQWPYGLIYCNKIHRGNQPSDYHVQILSTDPNDSLILFKDNNVSFINDEYIQTCTDSIQMIKEWVSEGKGVILGLDVTDKLMSEFTVYMLNPNRDYFTWPNDDDAKVIGGHCVACVGYDKNQFYIQNSWGTNLTMTDTQSTSPQMLQLLPFDVFNQLFKYAVCYKIKDDYIVKSYALTWNIIKNTNGVPILEHSLLGLPIEKSSNPDDIERFTYRNMSDFISGDIKEFGQIVGPAGTNIATIKPTFDGVFKLNFHRNPDAVSHLIRSGRLHIDMTGRSQQSSLWVRDTSAEFKVFSGGETGVVDLNLPLGNTIKQ
jgi:hypothetical protein